MPNFAVPGLMPTGHPKYDSKIKTRADGSLRLVVYTTEDTTSPLPSGRLIIADVSGTNILEDLTHSCFFKETSASLQCLTIQIRAGVLPVGLLTFHVALDFADKVQFDDYDVEVPASPFHVVSSLDS